MNKYILSTSLIVASLLYNQVVLAGKPKKEDDEVSKTNKISICSADLPKEFCDSKKGYNFMEYILTLKGKSVSSIDLTGWHGIHEDTTFYGTGLIIAEAGLEIDEINFTWGHMAMTHPIFKGKHPREMEEILFNLSGKRTRFTLSFN